MQRRHFLVSAMLLCIGIRMYTFAVLSFDVADKFSPVVCKL